MRSPRGDCLIIFPIALFAAEKCPQILIGCVKGVVSQIKVSQFGEATQLRRNASRQLVVLQLKVSQAGEATA